MIFALTRYSNNISVHSLKNHCSGAILHVDGLKQENGTHSVNDHPPAAYLPGGIPGGGGGG